MGHTGDAYDVFFSYHGPDRAAVEGVAQALHRQGLRVFLDRWYLAPGRPWPQVLEEVLASCRAVAVFLGPAGLGPWQQREKNLALSRWAREPLFPVIPVLLPGADPALDFLSQNTWVDLRPRLDDPLALEILRAAIRGEPPGPDLEARVRATLAAVCPYRGLRPFREEDAPFFFGREVFVDRLTQAVCCRSLVAVVGASGCGKSSVARAGLLPRVRRSIGGQVWDVLTLLPDRLPLNNLAAALLPLLEPEMTEVDRLAEVSKLARYLQQGDLPLRDVVARVLAKQPGSDRLLLLVDQWEELYTRTREEEQRGRFLEEILAATQDAPLTVVLTLRGDFFGQALSHRPLADRLQDAVVTLGPMTRGELARAVEEPAKNVHLSFEPGLVERLLDDVGQEPGNLPLLEFALTRLWEQRRGGQLLHQAYEDMGRVQGAVAQQAEELYQQLGPLEQQAATRVFLELVQAGENTEDTRRRAALAELGGETRELVKKLADARLVVTGREEASGQDLVEVAHEALIRHWQRLQGWLNADREFLLWRQRLRHDLEDWQRTGRDEGALLRGAQLVEAEGWHTGRAEHLTPAEREFIQASLSLREREQQTRHRQQRRRLLALTSGLVLALVLLALAGWQWWRANEQRRLALSRQLAAQANFLLAEHPLMVERSVLLAVESLRGHKSAEGLKALHQGLTWLPRRVKHLQLPEEAELAIVRGQGTYLATLLRGEEFIEVWHLKGGLRLARLAAPKDTHGINLRDDGSRLVTSGPHRWWADNATVRVWDVASGREVAVFKGCEATWILHPQGRLALVRRLNPSQTVVQVVDTTDGKEVATFPLPEKARMRLAVLSFSPDGQRLALGMGDMSPQGGELLLMWDLASGRELIRMKYRSPPPDAQKGVPFGWIQRLNFSPDGRLLALGTTSLACLWEVAANREIARWEIPGGCRTLSFSPDSRLLATAPGAKFEIREGKQELLESERTVKVWDTATGRAVASLLHDDNVWHVKFGPVGHLLATFSGRLALRLWQVDTSKNIGSLVDSSFFSGSCMFQENGTQLVTWGKKNVIQVWQFYLSQEMTRLVHSGPVRGLGFSPDGKTLATREDKTVRLWEVASGQEVARWEDPSRVWAQTFSPDGRWLAIGGGKKTGDSEDGWLIPWDLAGNKPGARLALPTVVSGLAFTPDSRCLAVSCRDRVRIREVATGKEVVQLARPEWGSFDLLAYSPDGRYLAVGWRFSALVLEAVSGRLVAQMEHKRKIPGGDTSGRVEALAFSPDSRWLATAGGEETTRLWEVATGREIRWLDREGRVAKLAFSPDGRYLVGGNQNRTAKVWETISGREVALVKHHGPVEDVAFSPCGRFVSSAEACPETSSSGDEKSCRALVRVWEALTGLEVAHLAHDKGVSGLAFSPDGKLLASAGLDGTVRLWRWQPEDLMPEACNRLTRNLTKKEWQQYFGEGVPYRKTCSDLPGPEE